MRAVPASGSGGRRMISTGHQGGWDLGDERVQSEVAMRPMVAVPPRERHPRAGGRSRETAGYGPEPGVMRPELAGEVGQWRMSSHLPSLWRVSY